MLRWIRGPLALAAFIAGLAPAIALAHPGHGGGPAAFEAGLVHPWSGLDHACALLAVGLWGGQSRDQRAAWGVPAGFVLFVVLGGALGPAMPLSAVGAGLAVSVVVFGLLVAAATRARLAWCAPLVAGFALFHGQAHAAAMAPSGARVDYAAGFVASTVAILAMGFVAARCASDARRPIAARLGGASIAIVGAWLVVPK